MITATFEFNEDAFRRKAWKAFCDQCQQRLSMAGIHGVTLSVNESNSAGDHVALIFSGEPEDIAKAKKVLLEPDSPGRTLL